MTPTTNIMTMTQIQPGITMGSGASSIGFGVGSQNGAWALAICKRGLGVGIFTDERVRRRVRIRVWRVTRRCRRRGRRGR